MATAAKLGAVFTRSDWLWLLRQFGLSGSASDFVDEAFTGYVFFRLEKGPSNKFGLVDEMKLAALMRQSKLREVEWRFLKGLLDYFIAHKNSFLPPLSEVN